MTATGSGNGQDPELMTPGEVAALFRVDPKTVTTWANTGKLSCIRTLGGNRRYKTAEIRALLPAAQPPAPEQPAGEPALDDVARDHPGWSCWQGVSGDLYARLRHSSPPVILRASTPAALCWRIRRAEAGQRPATPAPALPLGGRAGPEHGNETGESPMGNGESSTVQAAGAVDAGERLRQAGQAARAMPLGDPDLWIRIAARTGATIEEIAAAGQVPPSHVRQVLNANGAQR